MAAIHATRPVDGVSKAQPTAAGSSLCVDLAVTPDSEYYNNQADDEDNQENTISRDAHGHHQHLIPDVEVRMPAAPAPEKVVVRICNDEASSGLLLADMKKQQAVLKLSSPASVKSAPNKTASAAAAAEEKISQSFVSDNTGNEKDSIDEGNENASPSFEIQLDAGNDDGEPHVALAGMKQPVPILKNSSNPNYLKGQMTLPIANNLLSSEKNMEAMIPAGNMASSVTSRPTSGTSADLVKGALKATEVTVYVIPSEDDQNYSKDVVRRLVTTQSAGSKICISLTPDTDVAMSPIPDVDNVLPNCRRASAPHPSCLLLPSPSPSPSPGLLQLSPLGPLRKGGPAGGSRLTIRLPEDAASEASSGGTQVGTYRSRYPGGEKYDDFFTDGGNNQREESKSTNFGYPGPFICDAYPYPLVLRLRVVQIVSGILSILLGMVAYLQEKGKINLCLSVPEGIAIILAASLSIHFTKGFDGYKPIDGFNNDPMSCHQSRNNQPRRSMCSSAVLGGLSDYQQHNHHHHQQARPSSAGLSVNDVLSPSAAASTPGALSAADIRGRPMTGRPSCQPASIATKLRKGLLSRYGIVAAMWALATVLTVMMLYSVGTTLMTSEDGKLAVVAVLQLGMSCSVVVSVLMVVYLDVVFEAAEFRSHA